METKQQLELKFKEWIDIQQNDELADNTITDYKFIITRFIENVSTESFVLDKNLIRNYKNSLPNHYKPTSINKHITILNKFLHYLGYHNCCVKKEKIQIQSSLNDPIWEQEHQRMLRWSLKLGYEDMYLILKIFAFSGIRVIELKYFTLENIKKSNYITIYNKGKWRDIIIRNDLRREILQYCRKNKIVSGLIFPGPKRTDKVINSKTVWWRLKRIARAAKINPNKIHPHAWRHLFAKNAKEAGMELDEIRDVLGHSKLETTSLYTKSSMREKKTKLERISYAKNRH